MPVAWLADVIRSKKPRAAAAIELHFRPCASCSATAAAITAEAGSTPAVGAEVGEI